MEVDTSRKQPEVFNNRISNAQQASPISSRLQQPKKRWLRAACQELSLWEDADKQVCCFFPLPCFTNFIYILHLS